MAYVGFPVFKQQELESVKRIRESEAGTSAGAEKGWATRKGGQYKKEYERDEAEQRNYEFQDEPGPRKKIVKKRKKRLP